MNAAIITKIIRRLLIFRRFATQIVSCAQHA